MTDAEFKAAERLLKPLGWVKSEHCEEWQTLAANVFYFVEFDSGVWKSTAESSFVADKMCKEHASKDEAKEECWRHHVERLAPLLRLGDE